VWTGIEILYGLQEFRLQNPLAEDIAVALSGRVFFQVIPFMVVAALYWFVDKRQGEIVGLTFAASMAIGYLAKLIIDQPRPWVLTDGELVRVPGANAASSSLPSGHTIAVFSTLVASAVLRRNILFASVMLALTAMVVASRLILCVHTPLDVISAAALSLAVFLVMWKAMDWAYDDDRRYQAFNVCLLVAVTVAAVLSAGFLGIDISISLEYLSFFYGTVAGRMLERIYVRRRIPDSELRTKLSLYILGMMAAAALILVPRAVDTYYGTIAGGFLISFWVFFVYPWVLSKRIE